MRNQNDPLYQFFDKQSLIRLEKEKERSLLQQRRVGQRRAAKVRAKETGTGIGIGIGGELRVVSPEALHNLKQKELQDVFGTQQSSLLSQRLKQEKITGKQEAIRRAQILQAEQAAQKVVQSRSSSGASKTQSTLKAGKQKMRWTPVYQNGKVTGHQQTIDGVKKAYLPFDKNAISMPRSAAYDAAFNVESTPGKAIGYNIHSQVIKGPNQFRVKPGRVVEFGGKTYKGGQFVPTEAGLVDNIIGRAAQGLKLFGSERSFLEENYPANFLENELKKRMPSAPKGAKPSVTYQIGQQIRTDAEEARKAARVADKEQKLAAHAKNRQDLQDLFQADKQQKIASGKAVSEQEAAARKIAIEEEAKANRVRAVLTSNKQPQGRREVYQSLESGAEEAIETIRKAPISRRTAEKLMSSNVLAAGVAAGGLGLVYASNRLRAEREVGR